MLNVEDAYVQACVAMTKLRLATCPSRYLLEYEDMKMLAREALDACEHFAMQVPHAALPDYDMAIKRSSEELKSSYDKELAKIREEELSW